MHKPGTQCHTGGHSRGRLLNNTGGVPKTCQQSILGKLHVVSLGILKHQCRPCCCCIHQWTTTPRHELLWVHLPVLVGVVTIKQRIVAIPTLPFESRPRGGFQVKRFIFLKSTFALKTTPNSFKRGNQRAGSQCHPVPHLRLHSSRLTLPSWFWSKAANSAAIHPPSPGSWHSNV